jgi:imidazole glycerol-phosphate synthase subunit HisF
MVKIRVMPTLLYKDMGLVKGVGFNSWRRTGSALQAIKVYNLRGVDELVFVDISASQAGRQPDFALIDDLADECFMPMTVGGGVRSVEDIGKLLSVGADKVAINSHAISDPSLIASGSKNFGSQCIVVSVDAFRNGDGSYEVRSYSGTCNTGFDPVTWAKQAEQLGAGEILLTSINRDGTFEGYDIELIKAVSSAVGIPVIASGGAGNYEHMAEVLRETSASAVAAASIFHFTEQTPMEAKRHLAAAGFNVRLPSP